MFEIYEKTRTLLQRLSVSLTWRLDREMRRRLILHETGRRVFFRIFAFDEGERLLFVYRTRSSNRSVCHAISRFGRYLGPAWHTLPQSHVFGSFSCPGAGIYFVSLVHRWKVGDSVYHRFVYSFPRSFQLTFFIVGNFHSKIIVWVDIMLTMCFAHVQCICFYECKQDRLRSTIFDPITNYIFSLLKAIYSVVFAFVSHHFWKINRKLNSETLAFSFH